MESKKKILRYITGIDEKKSTDDIKIPKWRSEKIETAHVRCYHNNISVLLSLSHSARILLDFVLQEMDRWNFIANDKLLKNNLNRLLKSSGNQPYADGTINKCFNELAGTDLVIKHKSYGRGVYRVNPRYYGKIPENQRLDMLRSMKEQPYKDQNNMIRREAFVKGKVKKEEK